MLEPNRQTWLKPRRYEPIVRVREEQRESAFPLFPGIWCLRNRD